MILWVILTVRSVLEPAGIRTHASAINRNRKLQCDRAANSAIVTENVIFTCSHFFIELIFLCYFCNLLYENTFFFCCKKNCFFLCCIKRVHFNFTLLTILQTENSNSVQFNRLFYLKLLDVQRYKTSLKNRRWHTKLNYVGGNSQ